MPFLELPRRLEYRRVGPNSPDSPTIVLLHHGLGSVSSWKEFPEAVAEATGLGVLAYSRYGHGESAVVPPAAGPLEFMFEEATGPLLQLLLGLDVQRPILVGHSDGASISILYAAARLDPRPMGLVLIAPHVFVEACTVASAVAARSDFEVGELREKLGKHHADPEAVFGQWTGNWLAPEFNAWNIERAVGLIECPITVVQGLDDEYGTVEQVDRIRRAAVRPIEAVLLEECGHSPPRDQPEATLGAICATVTRAVRALPER